LIANAYGNIGGNAELNSPNSIISSDLNFWQGEDIHNSPDFDLIVFGKKTKYGLKITGVGHDGTKSAIRKLSPI
jgi:hypothetical protein